MIGFFEYQYLSFKKNNLSNLVALAAIDGHIHQDEIDYLFKVGKKYQLKTHQIQEILDQKEQLEVKIPEEHYQKVAILYDLIGMMLADHIIKDAEMDFCKSMFERFGYRADLVDEMIECFRKENGDFREWEKTVEKAKQYQIDSK